MPIYEYLCTECGEITELLVKTSEVEKGFKPTCKKCGSEKLARIFSGFSMMGSKGGRNSPPT